MSKNCKNCKWCVWGTAITNEFYTYQYAKCIKLRENVISLTQFNSCKLFTQKEKMK